jgi:uncharacterized protein (TIGR03382 family)
MGGGGSNPRRASLPGTLNGSTDPAVPLVLFALAIAWSIALLFGAMEFDRGLMLLARQSTGSRAAEVAAWISEWGATIPLAMAAMLGSAWLLHRRRWADAAILIAITASGRLMVGIQKDWLMRARPDPLEQLVAVDTYAFPSGHAANATITWLCLALLLPRTARARNAAVWAASWAAIAVGASRPMLGVHWPSDVIGGWAFGMFWTLLLLQITGRPLGAEVPTARFGAETPGLPARYPGEGEDDEPSTHSRSKPDRRERPSD